MTSLPALKDSVLEIEGRIAILTFNRDDVRNALTSTDLVSEIPDTAFQAICHKTEDHQEALAAFFEKRPGRFKGR